MHKISYPPDTRVLFILLIWGAARHHEDQCFATYGAKSRCSISRSRDGGRYAHQASWEQIVSFWVLNVHKTKDLTQSCSMITIEVFFILSVSLPVFLYWSCACLWFAHCELDRVGQGYLEAEVIADHDLVSWLVRISFGFVWPGHGIIWYIVGLLLSWRDTMTQSSVCALICSLVACSFNIVATASKRTNGTCLHET